MPCQRFPWRRLARGGRTVCVTIHQPNRWVLLAAGCCSPWATHPALCPKHVAWHTRRTHVARLLCPSALPYSCRPPNPYPTPTSTCHSIITSMFDDFMLLVGGRAAYAGPWSGAVDHFASAG